MLKQIAKIENCSVCLLTKEVAKQFQKEITSIWNLIPLSNHGVNDILKEKNDGQSYLGKWKHSLLLLNVSKTEVIGFIVGYERKAEDNNHYPTNSLHLKSLSISKHHQQKGLGKKLVRIWLDYTKQVGFIYLKGRLEFSTQTNSATWNVHVQKFYESFGFKKTGIMHFENKTDFIYYLNK